jgi:hypothetical protein
MTKMVKSNATRVSGLMRGIKRVRYHSSPLALMRTDRGDEAGDERYT